MTTQQQRTNLGLGSDASIPVTFSSQKQQSQGDAELKQPEAGTGALGGGKAMMAQEQREVPQAHGDKWREVPIGQYEEIDEPRGGKQQQQQPQQGGNQPLQQPSQLQQQQAPLKGKPEIEEEQPSSQKQQQPVQSGSKTVAEQKECTSCKPVKPTEKEAVGVSPGGVGRELGDLKLLQEGHGEPPESYPSTFVQERVVARGLAEHNEPAVTKATPDNEIDYIDPEQSQSYLARVAMEGPHQQRQA